MISRCFLRAGCVLFAICCLLTVAIVADSSTSSSSSSSSSFDVRSPLYQHLPDCRDGKNIEWITKQTEEKGLVCPMFRDEEGFLAEFVAYYQMHGIDHILLFDHGSSDSSHQELQPWVKSGYVTILTNISEIMETMPAVSVMRRKGEFQYIMEGKVQLERHCKQWGQANGFSYFFSVDIDEYLMPIESGITLMDAFHDHVTNSGRSIFTDIPKLNFQAAPHTLEPVDLLTIEAYQVRMPRNRLTYFKKMSAAKVALRLNHESFTFEQRIFIAKCCTFHECTNKGEECKNFGSNVTNILHTGNMSQALSSNSPVSVSSKQYFPRDFTRKKHVSGTRFLRTVEWDDIDARLKYRMKKRNSRTRQKRKQIKNPVNREMQKAMLAKALRKSKAESERTPLVMLHYARSLEKYELKAKTWKTASGDKGQRSDNYALTGFTDRNIGVEYDSRAAKRYGCQLRQLLQASTGQQHFLRPGNFWLRNVEHGLHFVKPGRPSGSDNSHGPMDIYSTEPGNVESSVNTYEYHGYYTHMPRGRQELVDHRIKKINERNTTLT